MITIMRESPVAIIFYFGYVYFFPMWSSHTTLDEDESYVVLKDKSLVI